MVTLTMPIRCSFGFQSYIECVLVTEVHTGKVCNTSWKSIVKLVRKTCFLQEFPCMVGVGESSEYSQVKQLNFDSQQLDSLPNFSPAFGEGNATSKLFLSCRLFALSRALPQTSLAQKFSNCSMVQSLHRLLLCSMTQVILFIF